MLPQLYPRKNPWYPLHRKLGGPQNRSRRFWRAENLLFLSGFEARIVHFVDPGITCLCVCVCVCVCVRARARVYICMYLFTRLRSKERTKSYSRFIMNKCRRIRRKRQATWRIDIWYAYKFLIWKADCWNHSQNNRWWQCRLDSNGSNQEPRTDSCLHDENLQVT